MATRSPARNGTRPTQARTVPGRSSGRSDANRASVASGKSRARSRGGSSEGGRGADQQRRGRPAVASFRAGQSRGQHVGETIKNAGSAVRDTVAEHPLPAALVGAGIAWLLVERQMSRGGAAGSRDDGRGILEHARQRYEEAAGHTAGTIE